MTIERQLTAYVSFSSKLGSYFCTIIERKGDVLHPLASVRLYHEGENFEDMLRSVVRHCEMKANVMADHLSLALPCAMVMPYEMTFTIKRQSQSIGTHEQNLMAAAHKHVAARGYHVVQASRGEMIPCRLKDGHAGLRCLLRFMVIGTGDYEAFASATKNAGYVLRDIVSREYALKTLFAHDMQGKSLAVVRLEEESLSYCLMREGLIMRFGVMEGGVATLVHALAEQLKLPLPQARWLLHHYGLKPAESHQSWRLRFYEAVHAEMTKLMNPLLSHVKSFESGIAGGFQWVLGGFDDTIPDLCAWGAGMSNRDWCYADDLLENVGIKGTAESMAAASLASDCRLLGHRAQSFIPLSFRLKAVIWGHLHMPHMQAQHKGGYHDS